MNEGENIITVKSGNENFDLDYLEITNNETIYDTDFELPETPANPDTSKEASALLDYMKNQFGKKSLQDSMRQTTKTRSLN